MIFTSFRTDITHFKFLASLLTVLTYKPLTHGTRALSPPGESSSPATLLYFVKFLVIIDKIYKSFDEDFEIFLDISKYLYLM